MQIDNEENLLEEWIEEESAETKGITLKELYSLCKKHRCVERNMAKGEFCEDIVQPYLGRYLNGYDEAAWDKFDLLQDRDF